MRHEYGQKVADSLLSQCHNTAVFPLQSTETREYCANLFGSYEVWERPRTSKASDIRGALSLDPRDLYQHPQLHERRTLHPSEPLTLPRPNITGRISGYFITGDLGAHYESYPFADTLLPPANVPVLLPRDPADQNLPDRLTAADLKRLGITATNASTTRKARSKARRSAASTKPHSNSLRSIERMTSPPNSKHN